MNIPSLLPYVMPETGGIHLNLTCAETSDTPSGNTSGIFNIMDEPDGLTRLYEASIMTDAESHVSRLFLLVQRNRYSVGADDMDGFNNMDIELCWQRAFMYYTKESAEMPVHLFAGQKGKGEILLPFHSLFYCREKKTYFHPPCPECGELLTQCHDDELLTSAGLPAYSGSLDRFLFCPTCHEAGQSVPFYMADRDGRYDPSAVKDQSDLIRAFGNLGNARNAPGALPCISCDRHDLCYGPEYFAGVNIIPFSFYPFYMLAFDGGSMNAADFIALLSEASTEEILSDLESESLNGRMACVEKLNRQPYTPAFFYREEDDRRFLEILYLKLTFLQEVFTHFFSHLDNPHYPNPDMNLGRLWVRLNKRVGLLPFFWNFTVLPFCGVTGHGGKELKDKQVLPFNRLYDMGLAWLQVLIANQENDIHIIRQAIMQSLEIEDIADEDAWEATLMDAYPSVFSPEHIRRKGSEFFIDDNSQALFNKAVHMGLALIRSGLGYERKWSEVTFDLDLKTLRETIAETLFPHVHSPAAVQEDPDANIRKILVKVRKKILSRTNARLLSDKDTDDQAVTMKTVILNPPNPSSEDTMEETMVGQPSWKQAADKDPDETLDKTVIHRPSDVSADKENGDAHPQNDDILSETVIYRPDDAGLSEKPGTAETIVNVPDDDDVFSETVMLGAVNPETPKTKEASGPPVIPPSEDEDDDLSRTVLLHSPSSQKTETAPPDEDDGLEETRIVSKHEPEKAIKKNLWGDAIDDSDEDDFLEKTMRIGKDKKKRT